MQNSLVVAKTFRFRHVINRHFMFMVNGELMSETDTSRSTLWVSLMIHIGVHDSEYSCVSSTGGVAYQSVYSDQSWLGPEPTPTPFMAIAWLW